jgi:post-segregation antitoxin (ccd killing protein)
MQRTQIFLTKAEQTGLQRLAKSRGSSVSALIREAVDRYLEQAPLENWQAQRLDAFGLWAEHPPLELDALRQEERFGDWQEGRSN